MSKERWLTGTYLVQLGGCSNMSKNKMEHHPAQLPQVKITASESTKHTCYSSPRRTIWWKYICLLLSKILPGIIFSFFTSWGERKSRNGYTADVLKRTWSSGKMPEPESKDQQQTYTGNSTKSSCLQTAAGQQGAVTSLLAALTSSAKTSHCKSTVVRMK